jgi:hypothetical protein
MNAPRFGIWVGPWLLTVRLFGCFFQVKLVRDEIYSQRHDPKRWRFCGVSLRIGGTGQ